jgi:hypothetical protein
LDTIITTTTTTNAEFYNYVFFLFLSSYMFRHCHYSQGAYSEISLKPTGKGKTMPLEVWNSPEASRRLRLPDFKVIGT